MATSNIYASIKEKAAEAKRLRQQAVSEERDLIDVNVKGEIIPLKD